MRKREEKGVLCTLRRLAFMGERWFFYLHESRGGEDGYRQVFLCMVSVFLNKLLGNVICGR